MIERFDGPAFAVYYDGKRLDATTEGITVRDVIRTQDEVTHTITHLEYAPDGVRVEHHELAYPDSSVLERWVTVHNLGDAVVRVERLDSICLELSPDEYDLMHYTSTWGREFEGVRERMAGPVILETRTGRSSNEQHPWCALFGSDGEVLSAAVSWSGNWVLRFEPLDGGGYRLSGGLHDWEFFKDLAPRRSVEGAHVVTVVGSDHDLNTVSTQYARVGRRFWYPRNELSQNLPIEWNHWWSYEDRNISEDVFRQNVDVAARLGIEVCTLDAGWFGPTDDGAHWYDYRGDWDQVNTARFPSGIRKLSDYVHGKGLGFGLWCEIEGLGRCARLNETHPEYVALRGSEHLGFVCFGNPDARQWAFSTLDRLIAEYRCDWLKLDFNVDPEAGCNRVDHGHRAGDGLYEHYQGYYSMLERLLEKHPDTILENCSSGGLRIDLGISR